MPPQIPPLPLPSELSMPVRDILRGLRKTLSGPPKLADPVEAALPLELKDIAQGVARFARAGLDPLTPPRPGLDRVTQLLGFSADRATADLFADLAYRGLGLVLARQERSDLMVSETLARIAYDSAMANAAGDAFHRARDLYQNLRDHHVIGAAPGTGLGLEAADTRVIQIALLALLLWMLVARDATPQPEAEVLALCADVAASIFDQAPREQTDLAQVFETYAAVI